MPPLKKVILLLESSREFGRELLYGIVRYSKLHGPWSFYREPSGLKSSIPRLTNWNADGIIMRNSLIRKNLIGLNLPTILVLHDSRRAESMPAVVTNGYTISKLASEHLINRGLKNFGFCGYDNFEWSNNRKDYFKKFIEEAGFEISIYKSRKKITSASWYGEQAKMKKWLKSIPKPAGIMACNDDRGQQVLEICKQLEINVPEEVAVIGVDNDPMICDLCDPPLTSIALNIEVAGYAAAELLDKLMNGEKMNGQEIIVSATHVVQRQSTDLLAVNDQNVAQAINFIRKNARNKIRVDDVVNQTSLSRRSLEINFRKIVRRSIQQEIRRVRVEQITKMLAESNLSISEITALFNFTGIEHISRYFKKEKGMGLRDYRKLYKRC